jgi:hypothetical protein
MTDSTNHNTKHNISWAAWDERMGQPQGKHPAKTSTLPRLHIIPFSSSSLATVTTQQASSMLMMLNMASMMSLDPG